MGAFLDHLSRPRQAALVLGGYGLAVGAAMAAGWLYDLRVSALPYDTSGGMYAGGEMLTSLGVFLIAAVVPTLLGLWFVRRNARFWNATAVVALGFAAVGLVAALLPLRDPGRSAFRVGFELFGLAQLLGVPIWLVSFALFAWMAPTPRARRLLVVAAALELGVAAVAAVHWFAPWLRF